ncbi:MAG: hypothetical protein K2P78_07960 [Gemmataceae bacterium]|nr:hypothetical protein [Gemmataceae bacterium]
MEPQPLDPFLEPFTDPVERLLLTGAAASVADAEEMVLNTSLDAVTALLRTPLSDAELGRHPLLALYRTRGSRPREDDLL